MIASPRRAWLLTAACVTAVATTVTLAAPSGGPQRRGRPPSGRGRPAAPPPAPDRPALIRGEESLARAYDFILDARFDQVDAELHRACGPAPPEACDVLSATALWWRILLDPLNRSLDDEFSTPSIARSARPRIGQSARRTTPRHGSISAARTRPACNGVCCAKSGWRRRATASASSRRSNGRSSWRPGSRTRTSASGSTRYHADVAPAAAKVLRFFLHAAWRQQDGRARADAARAERRPPAPGRGRLPAPPHLLVVRAPTGAGARAAARPPEALSGQSAPSRRRSPTSRTPTCTT